MGRRNLPLSLPLPPQVEPMTVNPEVRARIERDVNQIATGEQTKRMPVPFVDVLLSAISPEVDYRATVMGCV